MNFEKFNNDTPDSKLNKEKNTYPENPKKIESKYSNELSKENIKKIAKNLYEEKKYEEKYYIHGTNGKALEGMVQSDYKVVPGEKITMAFTGESYGESSLNKKIVSVTNFNNVGINSVLNYAKLASKNFAITTKNIEEKIENNKKIIERYEKIDYAKNSYAEEMHKLAIKNKSIFQQKKKYLFNLKEEENHQHTLLSKIPIIVCGKQLIKNEHYVHSDIAGEIGISNLPFQIIAVPKEYLHTIKKIIDNSDIKIVTPQELSEIEKEYSKLKENFTNKINELRKLYDEEKINEALILFKNEFPKDSLWNYNPSTGEKIDSDKEKIKFFLCFNKYTRYSFEYIDKK